MLNKWTLVSLLQCVRAHEGGLCEWESEETQRREFHKEGELVNVHFYKIGNHDVYINI